MNRWRELPAWLTRAWPVLALFPVALAHWLAHTSFPGQSQLVNKIAGMLLQVFGGLLILYSINDNLGLFRSQSLLGAMRAWLLSFPLFRKSVIVAVSGVGSIGLAGSATASLVRARTTLEERIAYLEQEVQLVRNDLQAGLAAAKRDLESLKAELQVRIDSALRQVTELREKVERAAVGGLKVQGCGVMLAVYGAVTSVFA